MRLFDPWPVFFKREFKRTWPFLVGFAITGTLITKFTASLTGKPLPPFSFSPIRIRLDRIRPAINRYSQLHLRYRLLLQQYYALSDQAIPVLRSDYPDWLLFLFATIVYLQSSNISIDTKVYCRCIRIILSFITSLMLWITIQWFILISLHWHPLNFCQIIVLNFIF